MIGGAVGTQWVIELVVRLVYCSTSVGDTGEVQRMYKDTPTCLHTMYAENQTKWLSA